MLVEIEIKKHWAHAEQKEENPYISLDHLEKLGELDAEPMAVLEEAVLVLRVELVPVLSCLRVVSLDQLLGHWVQVLAGDLFQRVLLLLFTPWRVIPVRTKNTE